MWYLNTTAKKTVIPQRKLIQSFKYETVISLYNLFKIKGKDARLHG